MPQHHNLRIAVRAMNAIIAIVVASVGGAARSEQTQPGDGVHPNTAGYESWIAALREGLARAVKAAERPVAP